MSTKFTNNASSKLTQALTADATSMHIQAEDVSKFPVLGAEDFCRLTIVGDHGDHEIVKVTSISSDGTCTIERAQESTTAKEWPIENKVELRITAEYLNSITTSEDVLSLVSPIEEDISSINNNITNVENDILNIENKHASDIEAVNASITAVQENIENNISVSISNLEQSIADTNSSLESSINSVKEEAEASYVKKIGDTMTGSLNIKASHPLIVESSTSITKGTTPAENVTSQIKYTDKDGNLTGAVINTYLAEGSIKSALIAVDPSSDNTSELSIKWKDGISCGYAPSPAIDATSSEITTASWVNTKLSKYLPLTGGTITGNLWFTYNGARNISLEQNNSGFVLGARPSDGWKSSIVFRNDAYSENPSGLELMTGTNFAGPKLLLFQNGMCTWNGKNIVRSVGGINADSDGNVNAPYLPTAGGEVSGTIKVGGPSGWDITPVRDGSNHTLLIYRTPNTGAFFYLRDVDDTIAPGAFELVARAEAGDGVRLQGWPNGQLIWHGKHVVRSLNGVGADVNGNINLGAGVIATMGIIAPSNSTGSWIAAPSGLTADVNCSIHACMYQQRVDDDDKIIVETPREGNGWRVRGYTNQRNGDGAVIYFIVAWR